MNEVPKKRTDWDTQEDVLILELLAIQNANTATLQVWKRVKTENCVTRLLLYFNPPARKISLDPPRVGLYKPI